MKVLIILLLTITFSLSAQVKKNSWQVPVIYTTSIVLDAISDGMIADNNHKVLAHSLDAISIGCLLSIPLIHEFKMNKWYWYVLSYSFIRAGIFDPVYNYTRGLPLMYQSPVSNWDKAILKMKSPDNLGYLSRTVFFTVGFSIPLNQKL